MDAIGAVEIRKASVGDLPALASALGQPAFFADRLERQAAGKGILLVALLDGTPVGDVYLWCERPEEPEIDERLPGVPLVTHLEVHPDLRRKGIGTAILDAAEDLLAGEGFKQVALGVGPGNVDATRLYERRGYVDWGYPAVETGEETFRVLVKQL